MRYNIAIFGTFNVDNYGDVMFPVIFEKAMKKRGLDFNLFLFSPGDACDDTLAPGATVYSINDIERIHSESPLDVVIIGGGALMHYNKIPVKLPNTDDFISYNIYDSWFTPIFFAINNNIKIIFNLPQVPYDFPNSLKKITATAVKNANYISLRDEKSKKYLSEVFESNDVPVINVYPDSVTVISDYLKLNDLNKIRKNILPFSDNFAVIQFNPQKPVNDDETLADIVNKLVNNGLRVVLLPLGYTHNDDKILDDFNKKIGNICYTFDNKLNIFDMASIIAGCEIYIGASFHGAITAISYGKKAISYNYIYPPTKNIEMFKMYGLGDFVASNADEVLNLYNKLCEKQLIFEPKIDNVVSLANDHFDNIYNEIVSGEPKHNKSSFISEMIELLPQLQNTTDSVEQLLLEKKETNNHINNLELIVKSLQTEKDSLINSNKRKDEEIDSLKALLTAADAKISATEIKYIELETSIFWRISKPIRLTSKKIKNFASKYPKLLKFLIYVKGLILGGFKGAKNAVLSYQDTISPIEKTLTLEIDKNVREHQENHKFSYPIKFSVIVPLYNTPLDFLEEMIKSVELQTYKNWELCLADGSDSKHSNVERFCLKKSQKDDRIKYKKLTENRGISENTNACIEMATGDYIALFDHDDILDPTALFEYAKEIQNGADFIYCDEDKFDKFGGKLYDAHHKPEFAIDNLRANNYICHFTVFKKDLLDECGLFRKEFDGSQDHDMILRLTEKANKIVRIPKVLYHWRVSSASVASDPYAKPYTIDAGIKAVTEHLNRVGLKGTVESSKIHPNIYRIKYDIIGNPLVSIIIPNYNHIDELSRCIDSIINLSTYRNFEIVIVENNSNAETFAYYETLRKYKNIKVVVFEPENGFNYSQINNFGVKYADGEHLILLNNDVEIITPNWIEEMLMYSQRSDVGAVGAMLYYPNDTIQHAGVTLGVLTLAGHNFKHTSRGNPGYFGRAGYQQNISAVTAACLMMPKKVYNEINGFDEEFAVAFNDIDLCMRVRAAGYNIIFTPFAELYHYESISRGIEDTPEKIKRFESEIHLFFKKWRKELDKGDPYYNPNLTLEREDFSEN